MSLIHCWNFWAAVGFGGLLGAMPGCPVITCPLLHVYEYKRWMIHAAINTVFLAIIW